MRPLSPAAAASALARETAEVWLCCLTIEAPGMEAIRIVNDNQELARAAGTYRPYPFSAPMPDDVEGSPQSLTVTVDNVDRGVGRRIRAQVEIPTCKIELVLASSPNVVEMSGDFVLLDASLDEAVLTLQLGRDDGLFDQQVPAQSYTPTNSPGLFV